MNGVSSVSFVVGNVEIAQFLLQNGAGFSSYTLMDHPAFSKQLLRLKLQESNTEEKEVCVLFNFLCSNKLHLKCHKCINIPYLYMLGYRSKDKTTQQHWWTSYL